MLRVPLANKRFIRVTQQQTKKGIAHCMKWLVDKIFPDATVIRVVLDNLATHKPAALYETFLPQEAQRILRKLEFYYTTKHGSWLHMAEIEQSAMGCQCLADHISNLETLARKVLAKEEERNASVVKVHWRFSTADAHIKLKYLYPKIEV
jgi:hypothetical protein